MMNCVIDENKILEQLEIEAKEAYEICYAAFKHTVELIKLWRRRNKQAKREYLPSYINLNASCMELSNLPLFELEKKIIKSTQYSYLFEKNIIQASFKKI